MSLILDEASLVSFRIGAAFLLFGGIFVYSRYCEHKLNVNRKHEGNNERWTL